MSIQEQPVRYNIPEQTPSSSIVINRGNEEYDPFAIDDDNDDDNNESEQLNNTKHQKQESIRINNGTATNPVINNTNASSNSDKFSSLQTNEQQQSQRQSESPIEHNNNHSDHRSKSPSCRNHYSSDRKRLRSSSPNSSIITTVNNNDSSSSLNIDINSSSKHKKSYRNDERKKSKHYHKYRSCSMSSPSKSPSSPSTSNNNKKTFDSKDEKSSNSSHNKSIRRSEKRDDHCSHRARNYHSYTTSKYSSRDYSSSTYQSNIDRRTTNSNFSSPPRLSSKILTTDGNSSLDNTEINQHETSTEDRNRIYNRLKNMNDTNTSVIPINNNTNKISSSGPSFINTNGGSQRSRSNLIQIVTTEAASEFTLLPVRLSSSQVKSESIKPLSVPSIPVKVESKTNTNESIQSTITSKTNGNTADDMLMEEMLLEEEQEQSPVKSIDLDNLTIPETLTEKIDNKEESMKVIPTTTTVTPIPTTTTLSTITPVPSLIPSPTKKPYTLYKVPHTNHMTPPLSSRHKKQTKKESSTIQSESTTTNKSLADDNLRRTSLDERISNLLSVPATSSNKSINSSTEQQQQLDNRTNSSNPTTIISTPSDKSTESPQDIPLLISTMMKKGQDHLSLTKKLNTNDERRSTTSKHYTTEWLASQKPEEAPTEELIVLPSLVTLPTLVSSQPSTISNIKPSPISNSGESVMIGKLSEAMSKLIQKQNDTNLPATTTTTTTETEDTVPISAKHLERIERRKQREKRQSEIAAIAKEALKPAFKKHDITKDEYKEIMKKVVTKATHANEVDRARISKMIDAYVQKYRTIRQHNSSKTSNGNPS
ncbi:unnamed protein product [Rotaria sordida]|uniref:SFR19-like C-terminal domain-containing protein n=1 Tax=Rotaria sordida TaxID=392033 RepID=A0A814C9C7_9BILA|nr:unnamed protein product [Rotaria sordida]